MSRLGAHARPAAGFQHLLVLRQGLAPLVGRHGRQAGQHGRELVLHAAPLSEHVKHVVGLLAGRVEHFFELGIAVGVANQFVDDRIHVDHVAELGLAAEVLEHGKAGGQFVDGLAHLGIGRQIAARLTGGDGLDEQPVVGGLKPLHDVLPAHTGQERGFLGRQVGGREFRETRGHLLKPARCGIRGDAPAFVEFSARALQVFDFLGAGEVVPPVVGVHDLALHAGGHGQGAVASRGVFHEGIQGGSRGVETREMVGQRDARENEFPLGPLGQDHGPFLQGFAAYAAHGGLPHKFFGVEQVKDGPFLAGEPAWIVQGEAPDLEAAKAPIFHLLVEPGFGLLRAFAHEGDVVVGQKRPVASFRTLAQVAQAGGARAHGGFQVGESGCRLAQDVVHLGEASGVKFLQDARADGVTGLLGGRDAVEAVDGFKRRVENAQEPLGIPASLDFDERQHGVEVALLPAVRSFMNEICQRLLVGRPRGVGGYDGDNQEKKQEYLVRHEYLQMQLAVASLGLLDHGVLCSDRMFHRNGDFSCSFMRRSAAAVRDVRRCSSR